MSHRQLGNPWTESETFVWNSYGILAELRIDTGSQCEWSVQVKSRWPRGGEIILADVWSQSLRHSSLYWTIDRQQCPTTQTTQHFFESLESITLELHAFKLYGACALQLDVSLRQVLVLGGLCLFVTMLQCLLPHCNSCSDRNDTFTTDRYWYLNLGCRFSVARWTRST